MNTALSLNTLWNFCSGNPLVWLLHVFYRTQTDACKVFCKMLYAWMDYEIMGPWAQIWKKPRAPPKYKIGARHHKGQNTTLCTCFASLCGCFEVILHLCLVVLQLFVDGFFSPQWPPDPLGPWACSVIHPWLYGGELIVCIWMPPCPLPTTCTWLVNMHPSSSDYLLRLVLVAISQRSSSVWQLINSRMFPQALILAEK